MRAFLAVAAAAVLAACATATPYQPRTEPGGYGYAEQAIESNRMRISFNGNALTDRDTVENYLLYRAAEATLQHGYDYFVITNRDTDKHSSLVGYGHPYSRFSYFYFSPRRGWGPWYDPFWDEPESYREITRYEAVAEIAMFHGQKPADNADAFDAHDVQHNLEGRVVMPAAPGS
jgi:hypothetical protein